MLDKTTEKKNQELIKGHSFKYSWSTYAGDYTRGLQE